ncbi:benzoate-CoA ligase family protein [Herbihabitans rhizosphaerae]|uniref:Benzoate-CoA ligase family protein n=1 Tax=Herbihabitans rhizosphaerae TaxID=1872711 RepID=A0A4Q7L3H9_9PSEU|nr:benzoate-CoA ligase family protein [Herbihabitans rhizosphaerae]RZS43795.1 benzoate-CoA ligase family protein [Herbihabitans rhizosphaerae]
MLTYDDLPRELNLASHFVDANLAERADHTALLSQGRATTYAELAELTNKIGNVLLSLGVRRGQRVLLALSDGVEFVATWYAAQKIGAITAEVYTFLRAKDYEYYLNYTEAVAVIADAVTLEPLREAGVRVPVLVAGGASLELRDGEHALETLTADAPGTLEPAPTTRDDLTIWKFTTGSTGRPKACPHPTHSAVLSHEWYARGVLDIQPDDIVLPVPKLFFGYARDLAALYPFGVGGAGIAFAERSTPDKIFDLIEAHRPTILVNVPTMMSAMVAHPRASTVDMSSLRLCTSAGEALPAELHRKWDEAFGVEVVDGIGSSEAYHIYISNRPGSPRPGSIGREVPGYTARIVDLDGNTLPDGEVGTLEITGATVAHGYYGDAEKSAGTFSGDTLLTGDLFVRDADGYFQYRGRADDLLKVGGIWVAPSEIEHCLIGHPDVLECAVVGYEQDGLVRPRAYVITRDDARPDLEAYAKERLSPHKRPRDVRFVDTLPRTDNGKLDRKALRALDGVA